MKKSTLLIIFLVALVPIGIYFLNKKPNTQVKPYSWTNDFKKRNEE